MQREKYFVENESKRVKTIYVHKDALPNGKKFFFESLGINTQQLSYEKIYSSWEIE